MNTFSITKAITRSVLVLLFLVVTGFSLLLAQEITWPLIGFSFLKGLLAVVFGWIFVLILSDTMVKSVVSSAVEARASRREGGMLFHFLKPEYGEIIEDAGTGSKKKAKSA